MAMTPDIREKARALMEATDAPMNEKWFGAVTRAFDALRDALDAEEGDGERQDGRAYELEHEIELCARVLYRRRLVGIAWSEADPAVRDEYRRLASQEREAVYREVAIEASAIPALTLEEKGGA